MARQRQGKQKASKTKVKLTEREVQALELRKAGYDLNTIAKQLGFRGRSGAYEAIKRALMKVITEPALEVREMELQRLDQIQRNYWTRMLKGDANIIDKLLRVMDRRARLLGLDAPVKVEQTGDITVKIIDDKPEKL